MDWIVQHQLGDLASVIGLAVGLVGFGFTIFLVLRSSSAAQAAREAADNARDAAIRTAGIVDFSAIIATMTEIKQHHRSGAWPVLPDKYSSVRGDLVAIKTSHPNLAEKDRTTIQGAIGHFSGFERTVEKALADAGDPPKVPRLNAVVSAEIDKLIEILERLKYEEGT